MVESVIAGREPSESVHDGLAVSEIIMASYLAAEQGETLSFPDPRPRLIRTRGRTRHLAPVNATGD